MNEDRTKLLQQILDNVNNWLHFAEAKNAAIIAFNIAVLAALVGSDLSKAFEPLFSAIVIGLMISIMYSILSFKPINIKLNKTEKANIEENLIHFAYIASLDCDEYIKKLYGYYWGETNIDVNTVPRLEIDYCKEIVENSRITMKKQYYFKISLNIVLFVIMGIMGLTIYA